MTFTGDFERFDYFNFGIIFLKNQKLFEETEFEKWCAIRASVGSMLVWVAWVTCFRGCRTSVGVVIGLWLCVYVWFISIWRNIALAI